MAQVAARYWLADDGAIPRDAAVPAAGQPVLARASAAFRAQANRTDVAGAMPAISLVRAQRSRTTHVRVPEVPVEVRIGVQHATRELVIDSAETTDAILGGGHRRA